MIQRIEDNLYCETIYRLSYLVFFGHNLKTKNKNALRLKREIKFNKIIKLNYIMSFIHFFLPKVQVSEYSFVLILIILHRIFVYK